MKRILFEGTATALVTPMTKDGLDLPALDKLIDFQLDNGIAALVACGTTGEPSTLSDAEWEAIVSRVVRRVNGRVPVIAGTGGNNTSRVIELAARAKSLGANAQLCVTPYYNKTSQEGLVAHYLKIADESPLPLILYNVPSRTGLSVSVDSLKKLSAHENILALKEAGGDIARVADIACACGDALPLYSGADEMIVPMMALGAHGVISVLSNILPAQTAAMTGAWLSGDSAQAMRIQLQLMPLIRLLFSEVNPIPVKAALSMMGMMRDELRLPLIPLTAVNREKLRKELQRLEIIR